MKMVQFSKLGKFQQNVMIVMMKIFIHLLYIWKKCSCNLIIYNDITTHITKFMGPTWVPPGSCWPQMGPMSAPCTLLSGYISNSTGRTLICYAVQWGQMGSWRLKTPATLLLFTQFVQANNKRIINASIIGPLWWNSPVDFQTIYQ